MPDRKVVGEILSSACYLPESFTAALYFAWKYSDDFSLAVLANAKVGGDNCHRGVVVGSVVGMQTGIPRKWLHGFSGYGRTEMRYQLNSFKVEIASALYPLFSLAFE